MVCICVYRGKRGRNHNHNAKPQALVKIWKLLLCTFAYRRQDTAVTDTFRVVVETDTSGGRGGGSFVACFSHSTMGPHNPFGAERLSYPYEDLFCTDISG